MDEKDIGLDLIRKLIGIAAENGGLHRLDMNAVRDELRKTGRYTEELLRWHLNYPPMPAIMPILIPLSGSIRTFSQLKEAGHYDWVDYSINEENFSIEPDEQGGREFSLVRFNHTIEDDEDSAKSELLEELGRYDLQAEGLTGLCIFGEHHPDIQKRYNVVARAQVWRNPEGRLECPMLSGCDTKRSLHSCEVRRQWEKYPYCFLTSRKPSSK